MAPTKKRKAKQAKTERRKKKAKLAREALSSGNNVNDETSSSSADSGDDTTYKWKSKLVLQPPTRLTRQRAATSSDAAPATAGAEGAAPDNSPEDTVMATGGGLEASAEDSKTGQGTDSEDEVVYNGFLAPVGNNEVPDYAEAQAQADAVGPDLDDGDHVVETIFNAVTPGTPPESVDGHSGSDTSGASGPDIGYAPAMSSPEPVAQELSVSTYGAPPLWNHALLQHLSEQVENRPGTVNPRDLELAPGAPSDDPWMTPPGDVSFSSILKIAKQHHEHQRNNPEPMPSLEDRAFKPGARRSICLTSAYSGPRFESLTRWDPQAHFAAPSEDLDASLQALQIAEDRDPFLLRAMEPPPNFDRTKFVVGGFGMDPTAVANTMPVEQFIPKEKTQDLPIVLIHGDYHSGSVFKITPDDRPGWAAYFANAGYEVFVVDLPPTPGLMAQDGVHREDVPKTELDRAFVESELTAPGDANPFGWPTADQHSRFPGSGRRGHPVFEKYFSSLVPAFLNREERQWLAGEALNHFIRKVVQKPVILIGEGTGATVSWLSADFMRRKWIAGIVAFEPAGPPFGKAFTDHNGKRRYHGKIIPQKGLRRYGVADSTMTYDPPVAVENLMDLDGPLISVVKSKGFTKEGYSLLQPQNAAICKLVGLADIPTAVVTAEASPHSTYDFAVVDFLKQAGVDVEWIKLADKGIRGNGHLAFLEKNSNQVAGAVLAWIQKNARAAIEPPPMTEAEFDEYIMTDSGAMQKQQQHDSTQEASGDSPSVPLPGSGVPLAEGENDGGGLTGFPQHHPSAPDIPGSDQPKTLVESGNTETGEYGAPYTPQEIAENMSEDNRRVAMQWDAMLGGNEDLGAVIDEMYGPGLGEGSGQQDESSASSMQLGGDIGPGKPTHAAGNNESSQDPITSSTVADSIAVDAPDTGNAAGRPDAVIFGGLTDTASPGGLRYPLPARPNVIGAGEHIVGSPHHREGTTGGGPIFGAPGGSNGTGGYRARTPPESQNQSFGDGTGGMPGSQPLGGQSPQRGGFATPSRSVNHGRDSSGGGQGTYMLGRTPPTPSPMGQLGRRGSGSGGNDQSLGSGGGGAGFFGGSQSQGVDPSQLFPGFGRGNGRDTNSHQGGHRGR